MYSIVIIIIMLQLSLLFFVDDVVVIIQLPSDIYGEDGIKQEFRRFVVSHLFGIELPRTRWHVTSMEQRIDSNPKKKKREN